MGLEQQYSNNGTSKATDSAMRRRQMLLIWRASFSLLFACFAGAAAGQSTSQKQGASRASAACTVPTFPKPPVIWLDAHQAVFSGSNLSAIPGFTMVGSPTKGHSRNGVNTIRFENGNALSKSVTLDAGVLYYFWTGARLNTKGAHALFGYGWSSTGISAYIGTNIVGIGNYHSANGFDGSPPFFKTFKDIIDDTSWHSQEGLLGSANALWTDGMKRTLSSSTTGPVPAYTSIPLTIGWNNYLTEHSQTDTGALIVLDYLPGGPLQGEIRSYYQCIFAGPYVEGQSK
jgi:hypothetical protein